MKWTGKTDRFKHLQIKVTPAWELNLHQVDNPDVLLRQPDKDQMEVLTKYVHAMLDCVKEAKAAVQFQLMSEIVSTTEEEGEIKKQRQWRYLKLLSIADIEKNLEQYQVK